jgi:hypothetical protein
MKLVSVNFLLILCFCDLSKSVACTLGVYDITLIFSYHSSIITSLRVHVDILPFLYIFCIMSWEVDAGLEILAFPCNQFGEEEPGSNDQITEFVCTRFKSEFPIFDKVDLRIYH